MASEMTPGELADRLDKDGMSVLHYTHYDVLCKSLRFAADMEVLIEIAGPQSAVVFSGNGVKVGIIHKDGSFNEGSDIYSAARTAVEALKGRV